MKEVRLAYFPPRAKVVPHLTCDLGVGSGHFVVTQGGSEANFLLFLNFFLDEVKESGKNQFLVPAHEEFSILHPLQKMEELGCMVKVLPVDSHGHFVVDAKPKTSLLSFSWANPLTGVIQPVEEIVQYCKAHGIKVHLDASAVIGKIPFSFEELNVDFLTFDGDKIGTLPGIGGLIQRKVPSDHCVEPAHVSALSLAVQKTEQAALEMARLRNALETELCYTLPDTHVLFQEENRLPNVSLLAFPGVMAEALLFALQRRGVFASIGGESCPLLSSQLSGGLRHSAISFSLSPETKEDDLAYAVNVIVSSVRELSTLSHAL
jgi:cysteine desulfurase